MVLYLPMAELITVASLHNLAAYNKSYLSSLCFNQEHIP